MNNKKTEIIENINKYFKGVYTKKNIIWKISSFFVVAFILIMPFFVIRDAMLKMPNQNYNFMGNFVEGYIISNTGLGLSSFENNIAGAYSLQSIFFIIPLFVFIASPNKYLDVGALLMFFGGFCNLVDRMAYDNFTLIADNPGIIPENAVVDYWRFGFVENSFIFNYADVFIIFGAIAVSASIFVLMVKKINEEDKNAKNKI